MVAPSTDFTRWLADAAVPEANLTPPQRAVLGAAFAFLQRCGRDYYSTRLLSHLLLHCQSGLAVSQIARLLRLSRSAASAQQGLSSKEVVQAAHHRLRGRSHGKLLPRFAGPVAHFLQQHPQATRWDLLDFLRDHCGVSVSRMALHHFLKKYGLDQPSGSVAEPHPASTQTAVAVPPQEPPAVQAAAPERTDSIPIQARNPPPADQPLPPPPPEFFLP